MTRTFTFLHLHLHLQPEVATARARDLSREDLGGASFGLYSEGFDFFFKSDDADVRCCSRASLWWLMPAQNFMMWLHLFDNIVTNWHKLISVAALFAPRCHV